VAENGVCMSFLVYLAIATIFLIVVVLICKFAKIGNLKLLDLISVEFIPIHDSNIKVSTKAKFGIVVSSDGRVYKTQIETLIKPKEISAFCNATLLISGIGWFVYRQQFQNLGDVRAPRKEKVTLGSDSINEMNIELEPKEGWNPIDLKKKEYRCLLKIKLIDQTIKHKFTFQVRDQNIKAMQTFPEGQASVTEVPIIRN